MTTPTLNDAPIIKSSDIKLTGQLRGIFGESAVWSEEEQGTWWVDMHGHSLVLSYADGRTRFWKTPGPDLLYSRAVMLREDGGLLVALNDKLAHFDRKTGEFKILPLALTLPAGHFFNDATVDKAGRLIIGTMLPGRGNDAKAALYQINADLSVKVLISDLNTSNGLAFSPDGKTLYVSDSWQEVKKVWSASYDIDSGDVGVFELFIDFKDLPGKPDGGTVDADGGYWLASMASPYVHRFTPEGKLDVSIELPLNTPTRPSFGGAHLSTIYLTTGGLKAGELDDGLRGGLLEIRTSFKGQVPWKAKL
jgi:L-arabinonolactonase